MSHGWLSIGLDIGWIGDFWALSGFSKDLIVGPIAEELDGVLICFLKDFSRISQGLSYSLGLSSGFSRILPYSGFSRTLGFSRTFPDASDSSGVAGR